MVVIRVQVQYFGILALYAGQRQSEVELPDGATLQTLLQHLLQTNPQSYRQAVDQPGGSSFLRALVNEIMPADDNIPLHDGDRVTLLPAISGGN